MDKLTISANPNWDDTKALEGAFGEYVVIARKSGRDWCIGGLNNWSERNLELDLSFLDPGTWEPLVPYALYDNHSTWEDDMIVGTVHTICYIEALYWLDRCGYTGWLSI